MLCGLSVHIANVALRKESVDRNFFVRVGVGDPHVALRKESVDRNICDTLRIDCHIVALRKESVDRNVQAELNNVSIFNVALRKESVDRNSVKSSYQLQP